MKLLAILAFASVCALAQMSPQDQAELDGSTAADHQNRVNLLKSRLDNGLISHETFQQREKEAAAFIASLRGKWKATPYSAAFEQEYQWTLKELQQGRPGIKKAPVPKVIIPKDRPDNPILFIIDVFAWTGSVIFFLWFISIFLFPPKNPEPEPAKAPALSDNYGTAAYAQQILTPRPPWYIAGGVFFGKSSNPQMNATMLSSNPGAPVVSRSENHTLIVARTRTGKGTRVIIPTLVRYQGSALVIDPKGENAAITARQRGAFGAVHVINPWGELAPTFQKLGLSSATYNPLDILDRNDPNAVALAQALAGAICPKAEKGKDAYWSDSAASVLTAVLLWITDQPGETKTLARAREIVSLSRADFTKNYLSKMAASSAFSGAIRENAAPFMDLAAETYSGVLSNLSQHTRFLSDPQVKAATAVSTFSMSDLAEQPTTVYLVIPPDRIDTQRTWLRLLITAGMATFKRVQHRCRCMFLIDEFAALGHIPELPRDIATMSGYGVDFTLIVQGIDQLKDQYGDAHATILSNCAYKWFCNVNDLHSAEYLSKTLGKTTVRTVSEGSSVGTGQDGKQNSSKSTTYNETGRELLMPDEILNLGRDTAILLHPNSKPHYLWPVDYWQLTGAFPGMYNPAPFFDPNPYHDGR